MKVQVRRAELGLLRARSWLLLVVPAVVTVALSVAAALSVATAAPGAPEAQASTRTAPRTGRDAPDLALVITADTGRTTTLRSGERDFARLWELLAPMYTGTERVPDAWVAGGFPRVRATVVWGMTGIGGWPQTHRAPGGDVAIERQDELFLAADGTPWVRTDPSPDVEDDDIRWHRAPRSVFEQWEKQGRLFGSGSGSVAAMADGEARRVESARWEERARWTIPALAAGLALGAGGTLLMRRVAARRDAAGPPREPRQELIDL